MKSKNFKLFSCCILVKGTKRSIICDVQRGSYHYIHQDLYEILMNEQLTPIDLIYSKYGIENQSVLDEYFKMLLDEEYIFFCNGQEIEMFPCIDLKWEYPAFITNAILDFKGDDDIKYQIFDKIVTSLTEMGCIALQLRFFYFVDWTIVKNILEQNIVSSIETIDVLMRYNHQITEEELVKVKTRNRRISSFVMHSAPEFRVFEIPFESTHFSTTTEVITGASHCGMISSDYFSTNILLFTEAQKHNTCLNRKISIDTEGYIRNCPSMPEHYGNIKDTTLAQALEHPDFKKYWFINKDQIEVCKDCEFRYICTDCRAYREDPKDLHSKPLKCGYNPYTCEWEEWSTNPLKQKAIDYYGMREMVSK
jgi:SPASM domain peptide maturase of grasp-with-spasm system